MIAVDTNILIYAHRRDSEWHDTASLAMAGLAGSRQAWGLPWPCLHEFVSIATHPKIFHPPSTVAEAIGQVEAWLESPSVVLLCESAGHWPTLRRLLEAGRIAGPAVHDARIAALCVEHGVRELWSADRDFSRYPELTLVNPLLREDGRG